MSASYPVGTNYLGFTAGNSGAAGTADFTIAALWQGTTGNNGSAICGLYNSTNVQRAMFEDSLRCFGGTADFSNGYGTGDNTGSTNLTQGVWYVDCLSKTSASEFFEWDNWVYDQTGAGTMWRGNAVGSANQGNGLTIQSIRIGANVVPANGLIAVVGIWTRKLSGIERNTLKSNQLSAWAALSPAELFSFENWNGTTGASIVGASTFSGVTGTVNAGANPTGFNFALSAAMGQQLGLTMAL